MRKDPRTASHLGYVIQLQTSSLPLFPSPEGTISTLDASDRLGGNTMHTRQTILIVSLLLGTAGFGQASPSGQSSSQRQKSSTGQGSGTNPSANNNPNGKDDVQAQGKDGANSNTSGDDGSDHEKMKTHKKKTAKKTDINQKGKTDSNTPNSSIPH
jgi:hypothetical protein